MIKKYLEFMYRRNHLIKVTLTFIIISIYACLSISCTYFTSTHIESSEEKLHELIGTWFARKITHNTLSQEYISELTWTFHTNYKFEFENHYFIDELFTGDWQTSGDTMLILSYDVYRNSLDTFPRPDNIIFYRYNVSGRRLIVSPIGEKYGCWELEFTK